MVCASPRPEGSIEQVIQRHEDRLYRTALAILGSKADAEDIVQETFIKLLEKRPVFQGQEHEKAWLLRVTINFCKSKLRSAWFRKTVPLLQSTYIPQREQRELVDSVMALEPKYRTVIHLFYYEGYSTAEIGGLTRQRESTVRSQLTRARQKLKIVLEGERNERL